MKKTAKELIESIKTALGENATSDVGIALIEDVTDSLGDTDETDWKAKYEENDKAWRQRYTARFTGETTDDEEEEEEEENLEEKKPRTYESLFE